MELRFVYCTVVSDGEEVDMDSSCASSSCSHVEHTEVQSLRTENQVLKGKVEMSD